MLEFDKAIELAKIIQKEHPDWKLAGGLSLMLIGIIPKRQCSDLDFATNEITETQHHNYKEGEIQNRKYCLFEDKNKTDPIEINGIKIQNPIETIYWKMMYDREKDRKDLKKLMETIMKQKMIFNLIVEKARKDEK